MGIEMGYADRFIAHNALKECFGYLSNVCNAGEESDLGFNLWSSVPGMARECFIVTSN